VLLNDSDYRSGCVLLSVGWNTEQQVYP
jgi:hypothetical protein